MKILTILNINWMRRLESLTGSDKVFGSGDRIGRKPGGYTVEIG